MPMDLTMHQMARVNPAIAQTIGVVLHLEGTPPPLKELLGHLQANLHRLPRLTHYLHGPGLKARWQHNPAPDLHTRVMERAVLPGDETLDAVLQELVTKPLPTHGPLWDVSLITGYSPGRYAICCRAHHSTQDGMGLLNTLQTLFGTAPSLTAEPEQRPEARTYLGAMRDTLAASAANGIWNDPTHPFTGKRITNWSHVPTQQLRSAAVARGGDTNDAFLTALSGALRTWCSEHWPRGAGKPLPTITMVNLRRPAERDRPGNLFTFAPAPLPCHESAVDIRLKQVIAATKAVKDPSRRAALRVLMDRTPARIFHSLATRLTTPDRAAISTSYVALHRPLAYRDDPVTRIQPFNWLPLNQPASIVACSYNGTTSVCFITDAAAPGLHQLPSLFEEAVQELSTQPGGAQNRFPPEQPTAPGKDEVLASPTAADAGLAVVIDFPYIKNILVDQAALPPTPIAPEATQAQAGIDSMAITVLSMTLEDRIGLVIAERELAQRPTVTALVDFVAQRAALQAR
ncbi:phosphopantetheine-binding protein [Streptomyces scopuliridis]|uniref:Phosphopantetheine-binding protein n=1 Tax=Streptomyces scopuliridis TaxID=452529 RepID=A0ACD4ZC38_9ACTN|nr:wax ester/triacylglycerol synthase domain-containing protein [Streptomyces scopuliridis]WSB31442.1 phosphopantetheine-binding protein [Streptomyces scopuliridis]WSB95689.1 phosphopantetheine-binding protein [Streptomyces scopuliridis]WSC10603.1 phosphopantetheine-binding protein [Streptomyces scopuliridis]